MSESVSSPATDSDLSTEEQLQLKLEYARLYIELGWSVLPIAPKSKKPLKGTQGINDTTNDFAIIESWLAKYPTANLAINPCKSGLLIVDWENKHGGEALREEVIRIAKIDIFDVPTVHKPSGDHCYFSNPGIKPGCTYEPKSESGVEILGYAPYARDNYAVAPYSIHPERGDYTWQPSPNELNVRPFPTELLEILEQISRDEQVRNAHKATDNAYDADNMDIIGREYIEFCKDAKVVREVCKFMGIDWREGRNFRSPFRDDGKNPDCSIRPNKHGIYQFHDFVADKENRYHSLVQVYAGWVTEFGEPLPNFTRGEYPVWQARMVIDAGIRDPLPVSLVPLPTDAPRDAVTAWDGFRQLLQASTLHYDELKAMPYAASFCAKWTGLPQRRANAAITWLRTNGYLITTGKHKLPKGPYSVNLYSPGKGKSRELYV